MHCAKPNWRARSRRMPPPLQLAILSMFRLVCIRSSHWMRDCRGRPDQPVDSRFLPGSSRAPAMACYDSCAESADMSSESTPKP